MSALATSTDFDSVRSLETRTETVLATELVIPLGFGWVNVLGMRLGIVSGCPLETELVSALGNSKANDWANELVILKEKPLDSQTELLLVTPTGIDLDFAKEIS